MEWNPYKQYLQCYISNGSNNITTLSSLQVHTEEAKSSENKDTVGHMITCFTKDDNVVIVEPQIENANTSLSIESSINVITTSPDGTRKVLGNVAICFRSNIVDQVNSSYPALTFDINYHTTDHGSNKMNKYIHSVYSLHPLGINSL